MQVPFFRPLIGDAELNEVVSVLRSGWLTSGPRVRTFEEQFAKAVKAHRAISVNSCTAALHLAVEAVGLKQAEGVLVPSMTFAASAEVIRYMGAVPILVDCDPSTLNMDLVDAERKLERLRVGKLPGAYSIGLKVVGILPVHVGGMMMDVEGVQRFAATHGLWVIEDAAHAFPAAWRKDVKHEWQQCGQATAAVTCFSFYANKTITTGEGGMAVTNEAALADRMRLMSLHGLSHDAWGRYTAGGSWDYKIVAPGFKYNMTDVAAGIGIHQLARAEEMRQERERIAHFYLESLAGIESVELPPENSDRIHSWHLFPIKLRLRDLSMDRNGFVDELKRSGVGCSVHWRPLHLHPYYQENFGWREEDLPIASSVWKTLISLPIFPGMTDSEVEYVVATVKKLTGESKKLNSFERGTAK